MYVVAASRPRCLAVAIGLTATLWGGPRCGPPARGQAAGHPGGGLGPALPGALALAAGWAWLRQWPGWPTRGAGRPRDERQGVRRLVLAACGLALASALTGPAHADTDGPRAPRPAVRAAAPRACRGPGAPEAPQRRRTRRDTLWALAEHDLPAPATDRQVSDRWQAVYRRNRGVIGADPDLIHPGQVLKLTKEKQ